MRTLLGRSVHLLLIGSAFFGLGAYVATILLNVPAIQELGPLTPVVVTVSALTVAALCWPAV